MMNLSLSLRSRLMITTTAGGGAAFSPASLFASGEEGAWYEPSTTTTFLSTTDLTPCGYGNSCGLLLDKSQGAGYSGGSFTGLGSELVTNGTFDAGIAGWAASTGGGSAVSSVSQKLRVVSSGTTIAISGYSTTQISLSAGKTYLFSGEITGVSNTSALNNATVSLRSGTTAGAGFIAGAVNTIADGETTFYANVYTSPTDQDVYVHARLNKTSAVSTIVTVDFDNISVRELPGNHATQATAAARPILARVPSGGRRNLLDDTENFVPATSNWSVLNIGSTNPTVLADQDGDADKITFGTLDASADVSILRYYVESLTTVGQTYTISIDIKANDAAQIGKTVFFYQNDIFGARAYAAHTLTSDYVRVSVTGAWQATERFISLAISGASYFGGEGALTDTGAVVLVRSVQLEAASSATNYQKVVDQYDITEAGVTSLEYLSFDGSDDCLDLNSLASSLSGADIPLSLFAGVDDDGGTADNRRFFGAGYSVGNGIPLIVVGKLNGQTASNFAIRDDASLLFNGSGTSAINTPCVLTFQSAEANHTLRFDGSQEITNTTNFGTITYDRVSIGSLNRNSRGEFWNGKIYSIIARVATSTAQEVTDTESYVANLSGVSL